MVQLAPPAPISRVLLVDNDVATDQMARSLLADGGYEVLRVPEGADALAAVLSFAPDLVFIDVSQPSAGGLVVLDRLRERSLDLAAVVMTAHGSERVAVDALRHGADDYVRKPFEPAEFQEVLRRAAITLAATRRNAALRGRLDAERWQLEAELARAGEVQAELLPDSYPELDGFEIAARCVPAREVGGDFYDWQQPRQGYLTLSLCDVMGKGMPAALWMATIRMAIRAVVRGSPPAEAMKYLSAALEADLDRAGSYTTLFLAQLDTAEKRLRFVDAGHGHAFRRHAGGQIEELCPRALPLGIVRGESYQEGSFTFAPGDALVVYSDGVTDARPDLRLDREKIGALLHGACTAQEIVDRILEATATTSAPPDDITVVALLRRTDS